MAARKNSEVGLSRACVIVYSLYQAAVEEFAVELSRSMPITVRISELAEYFQRVQRNVVQFVPAKAFFFVRADSPTNPATLLLRREFWEESAIAGEPGAATGKAPGSEALQNFDTALMNLERRLVSTLEG